MNNILETIKKELRSTIRDKKSLITMLVTPILIPLMIILMAFLYDTFSNTDTIYTLGINYNLNEIEQSIIDELNLEAIVYDTKEDLENAYDNEEIDVYIVYEDNTYKIYTDYTNTDSINASSLVSTYLETYNNYLASIYLNSIDADTSLVYNNISYEIVQIENGSISDYFTNSLIIFAISLAVMSITSTAGYSATDTIAGEKERGTLETILTFPIEKKDMVTGKYISVVICCLITSFISIILSLLTIKICYECFDIYKDVVFNLNIYNILLTITILIAYALFISSVSMAITTLAKTYKEAQSMLTPISFFTLIPMFLVMFDVKLNPVLSLIPILSHSMLINDLFSGNINYINIIIMFISTIVYVILLIIYIQHQYKKEKILFS